ncbi:MAG: lytic murein transglycosylase [Candidatus Zambryskibacteria bacterium]|nr:lytic murein transglycosylase [Candidatus Zambryskibacteria bacterium]
MKFKSITLLCFSVFAFSGFFPVFVSAQQKTPEEVAAQEAQWKIELEATERDIAKWQDVLNNTKKGTASLQKEASILNAKINEAKAFIKKRNIAIEKLRLDIDGKNRAIVTLEEKIGNSQDSLAQLLRKTHEIDSYTLPEVILAKKDLSEFFSDADSFRTINRSLKELLDTIRETKNLTEKERELLSKKRNEEADIKATIEAEKSRVEKNEKEKQYLITVNKTQEKSYEQVIKERQKKAAEIRAALFALRDTAAIPFGTAYQYALEAEKATGIRPAFLLAILTQETNLGKNLGACNKPDSPIEKQWQAIMPGPDDIKAGLSRRDDESAFLRIVESLGIGPRDRVLSCQIGGVGWGGAMGPSQFIPTTWESYAPRVAKALGKSIANPWNAEDAFMASSLFLTDLGAGSQAYTAERTAALRYYAGGNWNKPANAFYGNQVMAKAKNIQETMIDPLNF